MVKASSFNENNFHNEQDKILLECGIISIDIVISGLEFDQL